MNTSTELKDAKRFSMWDINFEERRALQQTMIPLLKSIKTRKLVALDIGFFEFVFLTIEKVPSI